MIIQISSGTGSPAECEMAVSKLFETLKKEIKDLEVLTSRISKHSGYYTSLLLSTAMDVSDLDGTVQWICKSPLRPNHKRKNWYIDVSIIKEGKTICKDQEIRWECFRSGGKGGQNVNKVETGVRLIHIPTGVTVTSTSERSQHLNKKDALNKLSAILDTMQREEQAKQTRDAWYEQTQLVRGNPVRVYEGVKFKRVV